MANQFTPAIQQLYVAYFNRPADPAGLTFWEGVAAAQGNTDAIVAAFSQQPEYVNAYKGLTFDQVVAKVYNNLFGHGPDLAGLNFWSNALATGAATVADIVVAVGAGAQGTDAVALESKVTAAVTFTDALDTVEERLAYSGDGLTIGATYLAGVKDEASLQTAIDNIDQTTGDLVNQVPTNPVVNHTLTDGIDKLVGTAADDNFVAVDTAWSALDSINGGAGNNTLTVAQSGSLGAVPAGIAVSNIQTVNLVAGTTLNTNVSAWTGVETINATAGGTTTLTAAASSNVVLGASVANATVTGGKDVTITQSDAGNATSDKAAGNVTINSTSGGTVSVLRADAASEIAITANGNVNIGNSLTTTNGGGANATVGGSEAVAFDDLIALDDTAGAAASAASAAGSAATAAGNKAAGLATLATDLAGSSTIVANNALTLTALNAGLITRDQKIAIDAAFATGLKTNAAAAQAAAVAAEAPIKTAADAAKAAADSDKLVKDAAKSAADTALNNALAAGGFDVNVYSSTLKSLTINGNYDGNTTVADSSVLKNQLTSVTLTNAGNADLTGYALTNVTLTDVTDYFGATNNVTIHNTTLSHVQNLTVDGVSATVTDSAAGTVNVASNGDENTVKLVAGAATAVNVSGAAAIDLSGSSFAAAAVITATSATGSVYVGVTEGQTFAGGSGDDVVTANGTAVQAKVVDGGAGNDTLVLTDATNFGTTGAAKFTSFEALTVKNALTVDVSKFTGSTFASVKFAGGSTISGLTAAQAANLTQSSATSATIGVTGATTVGQVDTVKLTVSDGLSARNTINIGTPTIAGVENLQIVAVDNVTIGSLTGMAALNTLTVSGGGETNITTDALVLNVNTVIDAHAATRKVTVDASGSSGNGLKIVGSDTAASILKSNALDSVLIAGNGANALTGGAGNDVITSGNGNSAIIAGNGNNKVTVGDGFNSITAGTGNDTIIVGSGGNTIVTGAGADKVTLGAHVAGVVDYVVVGSVASVGAANMDTITGFTTGQDKLQFNAGNLGALAVTTGSGFATMAAAVSDATDVADTAAVFAQLANSLNNTAGHEFAASTAAAAGIVARLVTFTTGDAAGTYLVINDDTNGFSATTDIVVKLVGNTAIAAGDLQIIA